MLSGNTCVIYIDSLVPDFKATYNTGQSDFPADKVFDFTELQKEDVYMQMVREEENYSLTGDKGNYMMSRDFKLVILATYVSDERCQEVIDNIPGGEECMKFIVQ